MTPDVEHDRKDRSNGQVHRAESGTDPAPARTDPATIRTALLIGRRLLLYGVGVVLLLTFLKAALFVLLITMFAVVLAMALNVPVTWLADHRVPRVLATLLVEGAAAVAVVVAAWLLVPTLVSESVALAEETPAYLDKLSGEVATSLGFDPEAVRGAIADPERALPALQAALARVGGYSITAFTMLILVISVITMVTYAVASPRTLLRGYLRLFPEQMQDRAARAYERSAQMVTGWLWSNLVIGLIQGIIVAIVLPIIGVPNALLWAVLAVFAELIPKIGAYIMSVPPILVGLAGSPQTGLVTLAFYVVMLQIMGNVVEPPIRGRVMQIHPAVMMFAMLAMASAFGFLGALLAAPVAGIVAAFVEQFVTPRQRGRDLDADVDRMLRAR